MNPVKGSVSCYVLFIFNLFPFVTGDVTAAPRPPLLIAATLVSESDPPGAPRNVSAAALAIFTLDFFF